MRSIVFLIALVTIMAVAVTGCTTAAQVKAAQANTASGEAILFQARVAQNQGTITPAQYQQVRDIYTKWRAATILAIDAEEVYLKVNTADAKDKLAVALSNAGVIFQDLTRLAVEFKIIGGGQ
jgi:hypothetical protein